MKRFYLFASVIIVVLLIAGCAKKEVISPLNTPNDEISSLKNASLVGKYIVVLKEDGSLNKLDIKARSTKVQEKAAGLLKKYEVSGTIEEVYETALQGFAVKMAPGQAKKMGEDPEINFIEADQIVTLSPIVVNGKPGGGTAQPAQIIPWGITRVGGTDYSGLNVVWIIDTGVDLTHPDLNVDPSRGKCFVSNVSSPNDDNGHGSHVAGIIAAKNNTFGVVGVAAGAKVIPIKVLDRRGSGAYSAVIAGVNYVAANGVSGDVANMSLGGPVSDALDAAVITASAKVKFALAAGNEATNANNSSPAHVNGSNIYTVSAMGTGDNWASFSNFGNPPIDYCAPGVSIYSTYKSGGYATMSGTSMAAPHMAGLLLLGNINSGGTVKGDPDGTTGDIIAHH